MTQPTRPRSTSLSLAAIGLCFAVASCGGKKGSDNKTNSESDGSTSTATQEEVGVEYNLDIPMVTYAWDPQAGDKSVSAEDGGPGFTGEGWTTQLTYPALGSPEAVRGGSIHLYELDWPGTLAFAGKNWNTTYSYRAADLCQETLLRMHPYTLELVPFLATHWKISDDKKTYQFRINPEARWSDGKEVTSADVIATYNLQMDERIQFPSAQETFKKFQKPVAISKYIVEVTVTQENWRNFLYFGTQGLFPAHEISIPGDEFIEEYKDRYPALSGPYTLKEEDIKTNESLKLTRRDDWWGEGNPGFMGIHNFDSYFVEIIRDSTIAFEKAKKGDLDYYEVRRSKYWAVELSAEKVPHIAQGIIQKSKFFNDAPVGTQGIAINMKRPPLDDLRVRKALAHLQNRENMIEKLFYNEYEMLDSYWQYGDYANANGPTPYDPFAAVELLEAAGWTELDSDGIRIKDGKRLSLDLSFNSKSSEIYLTPYQEDCKKAGIEIKLQLLDSTARFKNLTSKEYSLSSTAWGALPVPNPETSWKGSLATQLNNNNVTAFESEEVDKLLIEYDREYDPSKRSAIVRKIDALVFEQHPYVLAWYGPSQRVIYQNKFRMPEWGVWRTDDADEMMYCWWVDPQMEKDLEAARKDPSKQLETKPVHNRFWQEWKKAQGQAEQK